MKKLILFLLLICAYSSILEAQFQSVQSGKWYWPSTWSTDPNASAIPDSTSDVVVNHDINLDGAGNNCKNLVVNAGARIHNGGLNVYGTIQNYGTINGRSEWYGMKINLKGNLENYSIYDSETDFYGGTDQTVVSTDTLRLGKSYDHNPASKIIFEGPIILADSWLFLLDSELELNDTLKIKNTTLDGGVINGNGNVLLGIEWSNVIGWKGSVGFSPRYTLLKNIILEGIHYIYGSGNVGDAYGLALGENVINNGTITNAYVHGGGASNIYVISDFMNNGTLQEHQDGLSITIENSKFTNNGKLNITGITFDGQCGFASLDSVALYKFNAVDENTVVNVTSNELIFKEKYVTVDFHGGILNLLDNGLFKTTYSSSNQLGNITVNANNSLIYFNHAGANVQLNNAKIRYLEIAAPLEFTGETEIVAEGTLIAYYQSYPHVTVNGNINNYGKVRNHYSFGSLYLEVTGNILHDGRSWENLETKLIGSEDQVISIPHDSSWTGKVILDAMLTGTNYQWQKDGADISGATSKDYVFNAGLSPTDYGVYQCIVDGNYSRKISIGKIAEKSLEITDVVITNLNATQTKVEWKTSVPANGFIFYAENDTSNGYPLEAMEPTGYFTEHSLTLENLTTGSTYYFIIDQMDEQFNNIRSNPFSFVAGDTAAVVPLEITDVVITNLNETQTKVEWKTSVPANGFIFYAENDTSNGYPLEAMEPTGYFTDHSLTLENLTTGSTYYFIIDQHDADWNNVRSGAYSFVAGEINHGGDTPFDTALANLKKLTTVPDVEGSAYYDGAFISNNVAYIVTNHNRLFKTTDGGNNWTDISPEQGTSFDGLGVTPRVHFFNENIGAVAFSLDDGSNNYNYDVVFGYVWITRDGGQTWSERFDVNDDQILHLKQVSENVTYISGAAAYGVSSNKWFKKITYDPANASYTLSDVTPMPNDRPHVMSGDWLDENNGVVIGRLNYGSYYISVFRTTDGGTTWTNIDSNLPEPAASQISFSDRGIQMIDEDTFIFAYYYSDNGVVQTKTWATEDGGASWLEIPIADTEVALNSLSLHEPPDYGLVCGFNSDSSKIFYVMYADASEWSPYLLPDVESGTGLYATELTQDGTIWVIGNKQSIWKTESGTTDIKTERYETPKDYSLLQNYPNPFNPSTIIEFSLPGNSIVMLKIYNSLGEEVAELVNGELQAGYHSVNFNASNISSGIYFYRITAGEFVATKKMILIK